MTEEVCNLLINRKVEVSVHLDDVTFTAQVVARGFAYKIKMDAYEFKNYMGFHEDCLYESELEIVEQIIQRVKEVGRLLKK